MSDPPEAAVPVLVCRTRQAKRVKPSVRQSAARAMGRSRQTVLECGSVQQNVLSLSTMRKRSSAKPVTVNGPQTCGALVVSHTRACPILVGLPMARTLQLPDRHPPRATHRPPMSSVPASHTWHTPSPWEVPQDTQFTSSQPAVKLHTDPGMEVLSAETASTRQE